MPDIDFSASKIALIEATSKLIEYQDSRQPGLCLRVTPAGAKSWTVRYRTKAGERKRVSLGAYPALPVSVARTEAAKIVGDVARGADPAKEKQVARKTENQQKLETVSAVGRRYIEVLALGRHRMNGKPLRPSSLKLQSEYFSGVIEPRIGKQRLADLTRAGVQVFVDDIERLRSPGAARHCRTVLQGIFSFAMWQDIVTTDPTRFVAAPTWAERERTLTDDEIRSLWTGLNGVSQSANVSISRPITIAIKLAAVTLQRRAEVIGMRVEEVDRSARLWTIPGTRAKNGRTHTVPLSDLALSLIEDAIHSRTGLGRDSDFVFPARRTSEQSVGPMALTHAWRRLMPHLMVPAPTTTDPDRTKPLAGITPHDLRRTGATAITSERIGIPRFVVSQVLNHTSDTGGTAAVTAVYDRNVYMKEKRAALDAWAALLLRIVGDG